MGADPVDVDTVWALGLALPGAKRFVYYHMPALKVRGQMFACRAGHPSAGPNTLIVPVGFAKRERLIASNPKVFYLRPHYEPYPVVLVRLRRIDRDTLRRLLRSAHQAVSAGRVKPGRRATHLSRPRTAARRSATKSAK